MNHITFIECNRSDADKLIDRARGYLNSVKDDFEYYMSVNDPDVCDENHVSFSEYGLEFDLVEAGTFEDQSEPYYRYQISWGGPSEEIRFYPSGVIEYVFMDWFVGVGFDITDEPFAKWLKDYLEGLGLIKEIF